ncbi:hypothetical protein D3C86_1056260 [compost metagenome]
MQEADREGGDSQGRDHADDPRRPRSKEAEGHQPRHHPDADHRQDVEDVGGHPLHGQPAEANGNEQGQGRHNR